MHPLHLLIALAREREGIVRPVLEKCGVQPDPLIAEARAPADLDPKVTGQPPGMYISPAAEPGFRSAPSDEAENFKDEFVSTEHLLLRSRIRNTNPPAACSTGRAPPTMPF